MAKRFYTLVLASIFSFSILGCGDGGGSVPEGTPPTPEPGSSDYESYNNAGKDGPGAGGGAEKPAKSGKSGK